MRHDILTYPRGTETTLPFSSATEAWFWFIQANLARREGARISAGVGPVTRPCEPVDILVALERLYRNRRILMDHIRILHYYGVRLTPPDPRRPREIRARILWDEALTLLEDVLCDKHIVVRPHWSARIAGGYDA
ncbi:MAG: hypothetical protein WC043_10740 [Pseudobdellovibrionaceae bacterium]